MPKNIYALNALNYQRINVHLQIYNDVLLGLALRFAIAPQLKLIWFNSFKGRLCLPQRPMTYSVKTSDV